MKVYQLWDVDTMAGHFQSGDYCDGTYVDKAEAEAKRDKRNAAYRADFAKRATNGRNRVKTEEWNWKRASVREVGLK